MGNLEQETTGQKDITLRARNWSIACWTLLEERQSHVTAYKDFRSLIRWAEELELEWGPSLSRRSARSTLTGSFL